MVQVEEAVDPDDAAPTENVEPWKQEPATLEEMLDQYVVENKFCSSFAGGMLYLTKSTTRNGERIDVMENQSQKLFFAPLLQIMTTSFWVKSL